MSAVHVQSSEYTDEQLYAAWKAVKLRSWPTFDECMGDAQYSRLVKLQAWRNAHPSKPSDAATPTPTPCPAAVRPPQQRQFFLAPPPGFVDRKRAAAGDRDDD